MAASEQPGGSSRVAFNVYAFINLLCLLVLVLVLIEVAPFPRIPVADIGAPLGLLILFFVIPVGAIFLWRWRQKPTGAPAGYFLASKILWGLTWAISCLPVIFYGAFYLHYMPTPWLSYKQGPDSPESIAAFNEYFDAPKGPGSVHHIYHVLSPDLVLFRFDYEDPEVVEKIIAAMKLAPAPACQLNLAGPPKWWTFDTNALTCYALSPGITWYLDLGIDKKNRRVFFKQFSP